MEKQARKEDLPRHLAIAAALAISVITLSRSIGAFGEPDAILGILLQPSVLVAVALPFQSVLAIHFMHHRSGILPMGLAAAVGCVVASIPSTATAMLALWILGLAPLSGFGSAIPVSFGDWMSQYYSVGLALHATLGSILWLTLCFPFCKTHFSYVDSVTEPESFDQASRPGRIHTAILPVPQFLLRLPSQKAGQLWAISSERHFVKNVTARGEEMVLMRLTDAVTQCKDLDGLQVHRSHWVHRDGIARLNKSNSKLVIVLKNGEAIAVSRRHQSEVQSFVDAGLTKGDWGA